MDTQEFIKSVFFQTEENDKLEEYKKGVACAMEELDALCCKSKQDPYSDERDYSMEG